MKFTLLVAASALAVGLSLGGTAYAKDNDHGGDKGKQQSVATAVAASDQDAGVLFNFAKGTDANNSVTGGAFNGATGLFNVQQNGGANSIQQDGNTLGAILNCSCSNNGGTSTSLALSSQTAFVAGNTSIGAKNEGTTVADVSVFSKKGEDKHHRHGDDGSVSAANAFYLSHYENAVASSNTINASFENATGLFNVSQNVGNNSMQQATNTVAAIVGTGH